MKESEREKEGGREGDVLSWFAGGEVGLSAFCLLFRGIQVSCFLLEGKSKAEIGACFVLHPLSSPPPRLHLPLSSLASAASLLFACV